MQFIKHDSVNVETMFAVCLGRQNLIERIGRCINNPFLRCENFHSLAQSWTHTNHIGGNLKDNRGLLTVCGTAVNLSSFFTVTAGQQKCNSSGKFALSVLLWYLNVGSVELTIAVRLYHTKQVTDYPFLPVY